MDRINPKDAHALLAQGWTYVDVRTEEEFECGHPPGALNVPLLVTRSGRRVPNSDFLPAMEALFDKDSKLVIGCGTGVRSLRAVETLLANGFSQLKDNLAGWHGARDSSGAMVAAGWADEGLPGETGQPDDRSWAGLLTRLEK